MEDCYSNGNCKECDLLVGECPEDTREEVDTAMEDAMMKDPAFEENMRITHELENIYNEVMEQIPDPDLDMAGFEQDQEAVPNPVPLTECDTCEGEEFCDRPCEQLTQVKHMVVFRDLLKQFKQLDGNVAELKEVVDLLKASGKDMGYAANLVKKALEVESDAQALLLDSVVSFE